MPEGNDEQEIFDYLADCAADGRVGATPAEIGHALYMSHGSVGRALKRMTERGILLREASRPNDPHARYRLAHEIPPFPSPWEVPKAPKDS